MRSLLLDLLHSLNNVYSGWILWNLFLACVPLLLSFKLFRRRDVSSQWFVPACFITTLIGVISLRSRLPRVSKSLASSWRSLQSGNTEVMLQLAGLALVVAIALAVSLWLSRRADTSKLGRWWAGLAVFMAFLPNAPYVLTDIIHLIRGTSYGETPIWIIALVFIPLHLCAILLGFEAYVIALLNVNYFLKARGISQLIVPVELTLHALCAFGIYLGRFIRLNSWDILIDPTSVLAITLNTLTSKRPLAVVVVTFMIVAGLYWVMKQITLGLRLRWHYAKQGRDPLYLDEHEALNSEFGIRHQELRDRSPLQEGN